MFLEIISGECVLSVDGCMDSDGDVELMIDRGHDTMSFYLNQQNASDLIEHLRSVFNL